MDKDPNHRVIIVRVFLAEYSCNQDYEILRVGGSRNEMFYFPLLVVGFLQLADSLKQIGRRRLFFPIWNGPLFLKGTYWFSGVCTFILFKAEFSFTWNERDSRIPRRQFFQEKAALMAQPDPSLASGSPQGNARHLYENWNLNYLWENHHFFW